MNIRYILIIDTIVDVRIIINLIITFINLKFLYLIRYKLFNF